MKVLWFLVIVSVSAIVSIIPSSYASNVQVSITQGSGSDQTCATSGNCFNPSTIQINVGDTVTWTNQDLPGHMVTSDTTYGQQTGTVFQSNTIPQYGVYSFTFQNPGTYTYHDQLHPWMKGTIIVSSSTSIIVQKTSIPYWIKNDALWWGQGQISDAEFIKALQWLINQGILSVPTNSNPTSTTTSTTLPSTNSLYSLMPTSNDIGAFWKVFGATSSSRFAVLQQAAPSIVPTRTIEQSFEKTTVTPTTVLTIDMASFQNSGMSLPDETTASRAFSYLVTDYQNNHSNYQRSVFTPTPSDSKASCSIFTITTTESTKIDLFCLKGFTIFIIDASGNDVSMSDDVKAMANLILPKLVSF